MLGTAGVQVYDQLVDEAALMIAAGCQVLPPSRDTSTPATTPPPKSVAVPVTVTGLPLRNVLPLAGAVMVEAGGVVSVEAVAATSPDCSEPGCTPMSANRLTVACWRLTSVWLPWSVLSWLLSRPQEYCTVPAPKTSALLTGLR